jgi:hypothetical protein
MKSILMIFTVVMLTLSFSINAKEGVHGSKGMKKDEPPSSYRAKEPGAAGRERCFATRRAPIWSAGPIETRYVMFPKLNMYYDYYTDAYVYLNEGTWLSSAYLMPEFYSMLRLRKAKQVQVNEVPLTPKAFVEYHVTD